MELQHVSGRVWLYPHDPDPEAIRASVALIVDDGGTVLVDAGNSPAHARGMVERLLAERHRWYVDSHSPPRESPGSET